MFFFGSLVIIRPERSFFMTRHQIVTKLVNAAFVCRCLMRSRALASSSDSWVHVYVVFSLHYCRNKYLLSSKRPIIYMTTEFTLTRSEVKSCARFPIEAACFPTKMTGSKLLVCGRCMW